MMTWNHDGEPANPLVMAVICAVIVVLWIMVAVHVGGSQ